MTFLRCLPPFVSDKIKYIDRSCSLSEGRLTRVCIRDQISCVSLPPGWRLWQICSEEAKSGSPVPEEDSTVDSIFGISKEVSFSALGCLTSSWIWDLGFGVLKVIVKLSDLGPMHLNNTLLKREVDKSP